MTFKIKKDTYEFKMDKKAHLGISFGLFYFFLTYIHSIPLSICLALLVGFSYETYQGIFTTGYSHHDMLYNVIGVVLSSSIYILYLLI
jgi:ABC-type microcin C transport system permease subunit YejB